MSHGGNITLSSVLGGTALVSSSDQTALSPLHPRFLAMSTKQTLDYLFRKLGPFIDEKYLGGAVMGGGLAQIDVY